EARVLIEEYAAIDPVGARRAGLSDALTARLEESAAAQQLRKARWYLTRGDAVSARFMLRRVVRDHPRTVSAVVALGWLAERWRGAAKSKIKRSEAKSRRPGHSFSTQRFNPSPVRLCAPACCMTAVLCSCSRDPRRGYAFGTTHPTHV